MRLIIVLLISTITSVLFISCSTSSEKGTCGQYKTGTFRYYVKGKNNGYWFVIERNDSTQQETNEKTQATTTASIKWTSNCAYELRYLEGAKHLSSSSSRLKKSTVIKTEILKITDDYYIFRSKSNISDKFLIDTMWVED